MGLKELPTAHVATHPMLIRYQVGARPGTERLLSTAAAVGPAGSQL